MTEEYKFRKVNAILGASPKIGPFPTELIIPWAIISFTLFMICYVVLNLPWLWVLLIVAWGDATWWILTGSKPYRFLSKFVPVPRWTRGVYQYRGMNKQEVRKYAER
ncbi:MULTISPECIES: hypothetical protein [Pseudanabaena]|uniref:Uncharacterized protein n=2 Tax=Pseudanabaena TaxID=1152 RepID=L8N3N8_9CYAN|nr:MULTISPECIES: hypothetical protein [Pseudanabaena]ELS34857.1 hypothetical protein Pse7429DRAFT_0046 [Pseudanabaena biceps PCC 7429]MDG3492976.1 hypothetical protein [Pseudanabaena catenata USMAC16]